MYLKFKLFKQILTVLLLVTTMLQVGCVALIVAGAAAAGTGVGVAYYEGALRGYIQASPEQVAEASVKALHDMRIVVISNHADSVGGEVKAVTANDKKIIISIEKESNEVSKVNVRVGVFGDESISRDIYSGIKKQF